MSTNGAVAFGVEFPYYNPLLFPTSPDNIIYHEYVVAPYWSDNDARLHGNVSWEMYSTGDSSETDDLINRVSIFVSITTNTTNFNGNFVFVANWIEMHPYPAGVSPQGGVPYLNMVSYCINISYWSIPVSFIYEEQQLSGSVDNRWITALFCHLHLQVWCPWLVRAGHHRVQCRRKLLC